jgi:cytochrome c biogenesis protein CcdA
VLSDKGYLGSVILGMLLAFVFCPYSGVMFFGILIPLILTTTGGLVLPFVFAFGTGLPVIIFSIIIAFSVQTMGKAFHIVQKTEKWLRYGVASTFILVGIYYLQFLVKFILGYN